MTPAVTSLLAETSRLPTGIPPWMGFAIVAGWLAVVALAVGLFRWRRSARAGRRAAGRRNERFGADEPAADRQLGPGTDVERW